MFFNKNKETENNKSYLVKIAALLIHAAKIDENYSNEEEEIINGDNTFTYILFVPNSGTEVRIVGNKNGKKVKELIFTVKVGN